MQVKYIITTKYYNGDDYADKFETLGAVREFLNWLEYTDKDKTPDCDRLDSKQLAITTEEI